MFEPCVIYHLHSPEDQWSALLNQVLMLAVLLTCRVRALGGSRSLLNSANSWIFNKVTARQGDFKFWICFINIVADNRFFLSYHSVVQISMNRLLLKALPYNAFFPFLYKKAKHSEKRLNTIWSSAFSWLCENEDLSSRNTIIQSFFPITILKKIVSLFLFFF